MPFGALFAIIVVVLLWSTFGDLPKEDAARGIGYTMIIAAAYAMGWYGGRAELKEQQSKTKND